MQRHLVWAVLSGIIVGCHWLYAQQTRSHDSEPLALRAVIHAQERVVAVSKPVWVEFSIINESAQPATLSVPGMRAEQPSLVTGLPLAHVFSGQAFKGVMVEALTTGRQWDLPMGYQPEEEAPQVVLAPHGSVGAQVEVSRYYPQLSLPGRYRLQWRPYDGTITSNVLVIEVSPRKQAIIQTDSGDLTIGFFYHEAPEAVANFIELGRSGFYNGLTFHRIEPGYFIQGGDPNGDGTGIRPDGRKLPAEFSDRPQERGVVSMARLEDDPDSASCQFFICNTRMPQWDGKYTVFGQLVGDASYETLDKLMGQPTGDDGRPKRSLIMRSVRIVNVAEDPPMDLTPPIPVLR